MPEMPDMPDLGIKKKLVWFGKKLLALLPLITVIGGSIALIPAMQAGIITNGTAMAIFLWMIAFFFPAVALTMYLLSKVK